MTREGRIEPARAFERVIFLELCYLGRHNGEHEAPRRALAAVTVDRPLAFELNREKAMCCGAGGARFWMEEHIGKRINVARVAPALPQAPRVIATACPCCGTMINDELPQPGRDGEIRNKDIAEPVAEALPQ